MSNVKNKSCFIITPIGGSGTPLRRKIDGIIDEVIEPVLKDFKFNTIVSHRINDSGSVTNTIIKKVYESDLVIANLTGNNPNVMYEVAIRHASAKPIIHITENIADLPFDINDQRTIQYTDDMAGAYQLKNDLHLMLRNIDYEGKVSNPVTLALAKNNLINIPEGGIKDLGDMLLQLQDEITILRNEVSIYNYRTNKTKGQFDYMYFFNSDEDEKMLIEKKWKQRYSDKSCELYNLNESKEK